MITDPLHPKSLTLALLIMSEGMQPQYAVHADWDPAYLVIDRAIVCSSMSDEQKADLYARIAETVDHRQPLAVVQRGVSNALYANEKEFQWS